MSKGGRSKETSAQRDNKMSKKLDLILKKETSLMAISDDLVARVKATTDEEKAAHMALDALQAAIADLKNQLANGVDPAIVAKAIADLGTSADDLATAIPEQKPPPPPA